MSAQKKQKPRKPRAQPKTRTARRGAITYRESAQAAHIPRKSYAALTQIVVPRVFLRSCRLPPAAFRVLCHGLTYPNGWNVRKCTVDTGFTARGVRASLSRLMAMGYVVRGSNPRDRRRAAYRFYPLPQEIIEEYAELDAQMAAHSAENEPAVQDQEGTDDEDHHL